MATTRRRRIRPGEAGRVQRSVAAAIASGETLSTGVGALVRNTLFAAARGARGRRGGNRTGRRRGRPRLDPGRLRDRRRSRNRDQRLDEGQPAGRRGSRQRSRRYGSLDGTGSGESGQRPRRGCRARDTPSRGRHSCPATISPRRHSMRRSWRRRRSEPSRSPCGSRAMPCGHQRSPSRRSAPANSCTR